MQAPLDYATEKDVSVAEVPGAESGDITYAALLDRYAAEEPITEEMIRRACLRMESAQSWPFESTEHDGATSAGGTLARLFRARR